MDADTHANEAVWTIGRLLSWTTDYLDSAGVDEPRLSAELLLAYALGCKKIELYTGFEATPGESVRAAFRALVRRAASHEPIAYLVGHKEFYSLDLEVSPPVLIPRPETELLVERTVEHCRRSGERPIRLIDIGTGSGCIALAVLSQVANVSGVATDVSAEALAVARRNRDRHGLTDRLALIQADGLDLPADVTAEGRMDVFVSNPPYVPGRDWDSLPRGIRDYEPRLALAGGDDGLAFYRLFASRAHEILARGGSIFLEIGYDQRDAVVELFGGVGRYSLHGTWRDPGSACDRVVQFVFDKG